MEEEEEDPLAAVGLEEDPLVFDDLWDEDEDAAAAEDEDATCFDDELSFSFPFPFPNQSTPFASVSLSFLLPCSSLSTSSTVLLSLFS